MKTLGVLLAMAALITPFAVLLTRKARNTPARPLTGAPGGGPGRLTAPHPGAGSVWPVIVGMGIAIAVVLELTALSRRRRPAATPRDKTRRAHQGLLDSLAAGRDALTTGGEPREAIIACYVAMERAVTGIAAILVAGYAVAGLTGLIDVASVATLGVLIAARGTLRGPRPRTVRKESQPPRTTVRTDDFPAFAKIASDLEWAQMSQRHYEHLLRPALARLAATLNRPDVDLTGPPARAPTGPAQTAPRWSGSFPSWKEGSRDQGGDGPGRGHRAAVRADPGRGGARHRRQA